MANHTINLDLTTDQLIHLNNAISDLIDCDIEAISSNSFRDELTPLLFQCQALDVFHKSIQSVLEQVEP